MLCKTTPLNLDVVETVERPSTTYTFEKLHVKVTGSTYRCHLFVPSGSSKIKVVKILLIESTNLQDTRQKTSLFLLEILV